MLSDTAANFARDGNTAKRSADFERPLKSPITNVAIRVIPTETVASMERILTITGPTVGRVVTQFKTFMTQAGGAQAGAVTAGAAGATTTAGAEATATGDGARTGEAACAKSITGNKNRLKKRTFFIVNLLLVYRYVSKTD
jgi:hypothetical protein